MMQLKKGYLCHLTHFMLTQLCSSYRIMYLHMMFIPIHKLVKCEETRKFFKLTNRVMEKTYIEAVYMIHGALSIFKVYNTPTMHFKSTMRLCGLYQH